MIQGIGSRAGRFAPLRALCVLAQLAAGALAHAEVINCDGAGGAGSGAGQISTVPYTISAPGVYCVTQKITSALTSGAAITITANNVVLDLNGFAIGNLGAVNPTSIGVYAVDRQNIVVRNGVLRGFWVGVALLNGDFANSGGTTELSSGHSVEAITCDTCYLAGIAVQGPNASVRGNTVIGTKGSDQASALIAGTGGGTPDNAIGIALLGSNNSEVSGNSVIDTDCINACVAPSGAYGIFIQSSSGVIVANNFLSNAVLPTAANSFAIEVGSLNGTGAPSLQVYATLNTMSNWNTGIDFSPGSVGPPAVAPSGGTFRSNQALGVTTPYPIGVVGLINDAAGGINFSF